MRWLRYLAAGLLVVVVVGGIAIALWSLFRVQCENTVIGRYRAPDGVHDAVLFTRNCGATTAMVTNVVVTAARGDVRKAEGCFVVTGPDSLALRWEGPALLSVVRRGGEVARADTEMMGVRIRYAEIRRVP